MKHHYKDWTIQVNRIEHPIWGGGYRAEFWIDKENGTKQQVRAYENYEKRFKAQDIVNMVKTIIDLN